MFTLMFSNKIRLNQRAYALITQLNFHGKKGSQVTIHHIHRCILFYDTHSHYMQQRIHLMRIVCFYFND